MKRMRTTLRNWIDSDVKDFIRTLLLTEGFGFCLCISFIFGRYLDTAGSVSEHLLPALFWGLLSGTAFCVAVMLFFLKIREKRSDCPQKEATADSDEGPLYKMWAMVSLIILVCWIAVWLAFFPGLFSYDGETQISQIITGEFSTHHPLLHTLMMGACLKLMYTKGGMNGTVALYVCVQMVIMSGILGFVAAKAHKAGAPKALVILYVVFAALFPVNPILAISTTKDVIFAGLLIVFALEVMTGSESKRYIIIILTMLLIALRNNALYALVMMLFIVAVHRLVTGQKLFGRGLVTSLALGILAGLILTTGLKFALSASNGSPREALSVPIQQMARVRTLEADELDEETRAALDELLTENAAALYRPYLADPVKRVVNMKNPRLFISTWIKLGLRYPGQYLDAWLYTTKGAWHIYDTSVNAIYGSGTGTGFGYLSTDTRQMPQGFEVIRRSFFPGLKTACEELVNGNAFENVFFIRLLFSPALYAWIVFGCIYAGLVRRKTEYVYGLTVLLTYYLTLMLGPGILVRYMYPYMIAPALLFFNKD